MSEILKAPEWSLNRALLKSMGNTDEDIDQPIIGIANSWNELVPGHYPLREIADRVKKGIVSAGGTPLEFGTIAVCDGIAQGHEGMRYVLPTREIIAASVEVMYRAHKLDGLVLLASCDKAVPGMLMAAARLNAPSILVNAGPMLSGHFEKCNPYGGSLVDSSAVEEGYGSFLEGKLTAEEYRELEDRACPSCGSCAMLGTANTMSFSSEAMGMSLPGSSTIPPTDAERYRASEASGRALMDLVKKGIRARDIINRKSIENATRAVLSIGGSTNFVLHILAIAKEAKVDFSLDDIEKLSDTTPTIASIMPSSPFGCAEFHYAGGMRAVMNEIKSLLHLDAMCANGKTLGENITNAGVKDMRIIRTLNEPFHKTGGLAVLRGNIAPRGAIAKPSAVPKDLFFFKGTAKVFDGENEAIKAITQDRIEDGDVVVIRYEGPKASGMPEMFKPMKLMRGKGIKAALITDGRFSGSNNGLFVGHISPEALEGGAISLIEDGDTIKIDLEKRRIDALVSEEVFEERRKRAGKHEPKVKEGLLAVYSKLASSADRGAVIEW
jgi:dihydroxy-acid dehydratase